MPSIQVKLTVLQLFRLPRFSLISNWHGLFLQSPGTVPLLQCLLNVTNTCPPCAVSQLWNSQERPWCVAAPPVAPLSAGHCSPKN